MTVVVTYGCDRCGHTQNTEDQMWTVEALVYHQTRPDLYSRGSARQKPQLWCRACCDALGILPQAPTKKTPAPDPVTLESLIR
jgi:hypothetical protein